MGVELEIQIPSINDQKNNRGSSRESSNNISWSSDCSGATEEVETGRDDQTAYCESEQRTSCLSDCLIEELFWAAETSEEETHSEDEEEIGQDTADE